MSQSPLLHKVISALARTDLAGVTPHTLAVARARLNEENISPEGLSEAALGSALLARVRYPITPAEMNLFLSVSPLLTPASLPLDEISEQHAVHYMPWLAGFLSDPETVVQQNARTLLRWLVTHRCEAIRAEQRSLDAIRRLADDPSTSPKASAYLVYALGSCGTLDDYDRVIRHAEIVIEHDRDRVMLIADGLYRLYPPALINALQFFLDHVHADMKSKQGMTGMSLLDKVADIEDRAFWKTYYDQMEQIVERLKKLAGTNNHVEYIVDQIEKNLAYSALDDDS
ncbi:MAG: hypothetical protein IAE83_08200 [Anaerolinea sp.]|nr:hypothetical protein [Anaerolinea sp.]MCC6975584.1 hypothetical protein [Anaerolineae bacterium]CAG1014343.1 hypothetical protein ANRL4_05185 [Anaerolineae bacterium]